ncbi:MAG: response regulator [Nanoarchaeota archaeon]|nr:response regulator [Nanoarchaeota archaeon]
MAKIIIHLEDNLEYQKQVEGIILSIDPIRRINFSENLEDAKILFEITKPELIVTDYCLVPQTRNRDGLEFVKYIRSKNNEIPIIMYSSGKPIIKEMAMEVGTSEYIEKDDVLNLEKSLRKYLLG